MRQNAPEIRQVLLRLLLWLPLLLTLAWYCGKVYAGFFLPLYRLVLDLTLPRFSVLDLDIGYAHELVFRTRVLAMDLIEVEGRVLPSGFTIDASTPVYIVLIHPVVLAVTALAWPGASWCDRGLRLLACLPGLLVLEILDAPLVLASAISDVLSYGVDPAADRASWLVDWVHVMDGGGRVALSVAVAVLTQCTVGRWMPPTATGHKMQN